MKCIAAGLILAIFAWQQLSLTALAAGTNSKLNEAIHAYQEKRYHEAEDLLDAALSANPGDQSAHLWLARTRVMLLDGKSAKTEYENCAKLNPFSTIGRQAMKESMNTAGRDASEAARPLDDVKTVTQSVNSINQQANDLKGSRMGYLNSYQSFQNTANRYGQSYPNGLNPYAPNLGPYNYNPNGQAYNAPLPSKQSSLGPTGMMPGLSPSYPAPGMMPNSQPPYIHPGHGSPLSPGLYGNPGQYPMPGAVAMPGYPNNAPGIGGTMSNMATQQAYGNRWRPQMQPVSAPGTGNNPLDPAQASDLRVQALRKQEANAQAALYEQESANNLERLMSEKSKSGEPKLRALGTNLYTRYYGSHDNDGTAVHEAPPDPVTPMKATQMRFGDPPPKPATPSAPSELKAAQQTF